MRFHEIIVAEIQRDRSLKVFKLFTECVGEPSQAAAVHPQRVILLFNVRCANPIHVRHTGHNRFFSSHNFRRTVTASGVLGEVGE